MLFTGILNSTQLPVFEVLLNAFPQGCHKVLSEEPVLNVEVLLGRGVAALDQARSQKSLFSGEEFGGGWDNREAPEVIWRRFHPTTLKVNESPEIHALTPIPPFPPQLFVSLPFELFNLPLELPVLGTQVIEGGSVEGTVKVKGPYDKGTHVDERNQFLCRQIRHLLTHELVETVQVREETDCGAVTVIRAPT